MSNYPDDIHQYDNDPRSPFYDDGGEEAWRAERTSFLEKNLDELERLDYETIGELIFNTYEIGEYMPASLHAAMSGYVENLAEKQAEREWTEKDHSDFEEPGDEG